MMNQWCGQGRLATDPDLQQTTNTKKSVVSVRLAVQRDTAKYAEEDQVDWINLVFWEKKAETLAKYGRKGDMIGVVGRLQSRKWEDVKKQDHVTYEIFVDKFYFLNKKSKEEDPRAPGDRDAPRRRRDMTKVDIYPDDSEDELPF
jgi:single-strand DNA-binding protein